MISGPESWWLQCDKAAVSTYFLPEFLDMLFMGLCWSWKLGFLIGAMGPPHSFLVGGRMPLALLYCPQWGAGCTERVRFVPGASAVVGDPEDG